MDMLVSAAVAMPIPQELVEEIFIRLPDLADLVRTSAVCTQFFKITANKSFRRRFRALHPPPLLGFIDESGFQPAEVPHPSAPLAEALVNKVDLSFSFVPRPNLNIAAYWLPNPCWRPRNTCNGRVLLEWSCTSNDRTIFEWTPLFRSIGRVQHRSLHNLYATNYVPRMKGEHLHVAHFHLAVCDPLTHRYELLPQVPRDLALQPQQHLCTFEPMIIPTPNTTDQDQADMFTVICIAIYSTKMFAFVYQSSNRQWCIVEAPRLSSLAKMFKFDYANNCFYWSVSGTYLLVLDTLSLEFSTLDPLTGYHLELKDLPGQRSMMRRPSVVVDGDKTIQMFSIVCQYGSFALYHTTLQNDSQEWQLKEIIQLPGQYINYTISTVGAAEGFVFFRGLPEDASTENIDTFSLNVKTYQITKIFSKVENLLKCNRVYPYFGFPPSSLGPTV